MRDLLFLPLSLMLFMTNGLIWAQTSVHLERNGVLTDLICEIAGSYQFIGTNPDGIPGTFALFTSGGSPVSGHISDTDLTDDMAVLDPVGLDGEYRVRYSYLLGEVTMSVSSNFTVTLLDNIEIQSLPERVCKNDSPYPLVPVPSLSDPGATYTFSGPGVSGNQSTGYFYNPASSQVSEGWIQISLLYNSSLGCSVLSSISIYNSFVPELTFSATSSCIPSTGGLIQFDNTSSGKYAVESWGWNFGDPDSGPDNNSNEENPDHFYPRPGTWSVTLSAETYDGCIANRTRNVVFSDQPIVDFTWITDCFIRGEHTSFLDRSESPFATINDLLWTFRTTSGGVLGQIASTNPDDTIRFPFTSLNEYRISLDVENNLGCSGSVTKTISLKPIYTLGTEGYLETFDDGPADWLIDSEDDLESWILGEPDFSGFNPVAGDLAWYTGLPAVAAYLENSWIESPCFDLSALSIPLVQLDIMKSFVPGTDGAVMQYQYQVSEGWKNLGVVDGGINWFNSYGIFNEPGGSSIGWSLLSFEPDEDWVRAGYAMDVLADVPYVKFRIALGTGGRLSMGNQGFAFDNFYLGEQNRNSILEHFTNSSSSEAIAADIVVEQFAEDHANLVIDLQYHMDYPGYDPMNMNNPVPPSVRSFNYGVPSVPYAVLNGGSEPENRYDFSDPSEQPTGEVLKASSLDISPFDMELTAEFQWNRLSGSVDVSCKSNTFDSNVQLYVVVLEKLVTAYSGANQTTSFRNVVLDILPSASGKLLGNEWGSGVSKSQDFSWDYPSFVEDVEDLVLVAFVTDRDQNLILQSARLEYDPATGLENREIAEEKLAVYPNPANGFAYVNFGREIGQEGQLQIADLQGRTVMTTVLSPGYSIYKLEFKDLAPGIYLLRWIESGALSGQGKLVHVH
ncbi:MAG: PKD domain-containing protein [Bacteroidales bacterium]|nr:PKD domain-containing protein [Bacteroidales bacterium]